MSPTSAPAKPGPPLDVEARAEAVALGDRIDASPYSIAEVCRLAGLSTVADYNTTRAALRGQKTARAKVRSVGKAFARLTQGEAAPAS